MTEAYPAASSRRAPRNHQRAFSLAELVVVVGVIALLIALLTPPLQLARRQAQATQCSVHLQQLGFGLETLRSEYEFYPYWDDAGSPVRYTWVDVLIQTRTLGASPDPGGSVKRGVLRLAYCPSDELPDRLNAARHNELLYPLSGQPGGVDYSYGIGVPLSAGGWAWSREVGYAPGERRFRDYQRDTSQRVLAGDSYGPRIYNLNGKAETTGVWNHPTQYDNTVAWSRHGTFLSSATANLLFQDGHVARHVYELGAREPVNTSKTFVWRQGEPLDVNPESSIAEEWYPNVLPPNIFSNPSGDIFPKELLPAWYTREQRWTLIGHKYRNPPD